MKKRKLFLALLAFVSILTLVACSNGSGKSNSSVQERLLQLKLLQVTVKYLKILKKSLS